MVVHGQLKLYSVIKDYGAFFDLPFTKDKPDTSVEYKIVIEAGPNIEKPEELYAPLEHISRMYNLHVYSGVSQKNSYVELVIFGPAVAVVLDNDVYKRKFIVDNPNLKIIR
jgi:hypothetical protein